MGSRALLLIGLMLTGACMDRFGSMPDFAAIDDVAQMKQAFYTYLQPVVHEENARILEQRQYLDDLRRALAEGNSPGWFARRRLRSLAQEYELSAGDDVALIIDELWRRVDIVPADLALAQAAKESGWGRSRFAVDYNNLFGQWCYEPGCGAVPERRAANATHEVKEFGSIAEAVRRYMNNLNTHERYARLRQLRADRRAAGEAVTGLALAPGLDGYSERGVAYVDEVRAMIENNRELLESVARG